VTIADEMLEVLAEERDWCQGDLRMHAGDGLDSEGPTRVQHCLLGARLQAGGEVTNWEDAPNHIDEILEADPVTIAMAEVIREQFPEAVAAMEEEVARFYRYAGREVPALPATGIVTRFNDAEERQHSEVISVIEKVRAKGF
jgi:hypothetical protein